MYLRSCTGCFGQYMRQKKDRRPTEMPYTKILISTVTLKKKSLSNWKKIMKRLSPAPLCYIFIAWH